MRGRTNVMQRKEPTINGLVKNFIVASGNTIAKGDFVSYSLQTDIKYGDKAISSASFFKKQKCGEYFLAMYKSSNDYQLCLIDMRIGFEIKDSLTFTSMFSFEVDSNNRVYVGNGTTLSVYDVSEGSFDLIDDVTVTRTIVGITKTTDNADNIILLTEDFNSSTHIANIYLHTVTIVSDEIVLTQEELVLSNLPVYNDDSNILYIAYMSDGYFVIVWQYPYASNQAGYVFAEVCQYSSGTFTHNRQSLVTLSANNYTMGSVWINSGILHFTVRTTHYIYYLSQGVLTASNVSDKNLIPCDNGYFIYSYTLSSGTYTEYCKLYYWNKSTKTFTSGNALQFSTTTVPKTYDYFLRKVNQILQHTDLTDDSQNRIFSFDETLDLTNGYFDNVVEEYNGNYTVGFAKTGGSAGDTVQIYVPQLSS